MKALAILVAAVLLFPSVALAQETRINEWTTETPTYVIKGDGINYESAPDVFSASDPTIVDNGTSWDTTTVPMEMSIVKADRTVYYTRGDKTIGLKPVGIYYVDKADWDWSLVGAAATPTVTTPDSVTINFEGLYPNVDMKITSTVSGPIVNYTYTSKAGYPTAASLGMAPATTWVCTVHEIVGADLPTITADGQAPVWTGTDASAIKFSASKNWDIQPTTATSSDTPDEERTHQTTVRNFLVEKGAKKYFIEAIKYEWFLGKTFPVTID